MWVVHGAISNIRHASDDLVLAMQLECVASGESIFQVEDDTPPIPSIALRGGLCVPVSALIVHMTTLDDLYNFQSRMRGIAISIIAMT